MTRNGGPRYKTELVDDNPFATYVFYYRSLGMKIFPEFCQLLLLISAPADALKALMIIPRTPTPLPLERRNSEDLTADERLELIRRLKVSCIGFVPALD